jgi:hypothetical protein
MAQVIAFPGTRPAAIPQQPQRVEKAKPETASTVVTKIRRAMPMPKTNRPEDSQTIAFAQVAATFDSKAYDLAQTEPNSEHHRLAIHMAGIRDKLPCNNLRIFTTPEDIVQGLWRAQRRVELANAEWIVANLRRMEAYHADDENARKHWSTVQDEAEARLWLEYERLIRIPATSVTEHRQFKYGKWQRGVGSVEWLRKNKPELAAIVDDELARLQAEKAARGTKRKGEA